MMDANRLTIRALRREVCDHTDEVAHKFTPGANTRRATALPCHVRRHGRANRGGSG